MYKFGIITLGFNYSGSDMKDYHFEHKDCPWISFSGRPYYGKLYDSYEGAKYVSSVKKKMVDNYCKGVLLLGKHKYKVVKVKDGVIV